MKSNGTAPGEQGKRFLSTSIPTSPIRRNTTPPPTDGDNSTGIIIGATIGGIILFILIVILFVFYTKRKRRHLNRSQSQGQHSNDFTDLHINGSIESGQHNPGLDASVQEIYKGPEKALEAAVIDDTLPETEKEETSKNLIHNISIKLLTTWSDIYTMIDSDQYIRMKQHVEDSMETVYSPYKGFESATLLKFREGSVIADIQLRFDAGVIEPLLVLEKAIRAGRCADLEVDKNYFCIITPNLETIDGFSKKRMIEKQRIESGYYEGTDFDEHHPNKLSLKQRNGHSTKSTESKESMTSEMGSSYVSSTNISIYSGAEEDSHDITIHLGHKKKTGLLPHFTKHYGSRKMDGGGNSLKGKSNNGLQMGVPHIALFDFQPQDYRELKLTRGELVEVTSVDSGGWAKAVNKEKKFGWVPQNFISPIEPKKYQEIKMKTEAIHTLAGLDVALGADEEEECYHVPHSIPKPLHHKSDSDCSEEISQLFITIYPFEPNQIETESTSNELKLEVGDLIDVLKTNETGWWKGRCLRTEDEGWFPSSYVKPYMPEVIEEEKSIALSDTEVIRRAAESSILKTKPIDGYSSDNGEVRTKMLRENSTTSKDVEDSNNAEAAPDITAKKESVILRPKKGSPKERAVSLYIDTEMPTTKIQSPAPLTPPPRLSNHRDHGTEKAFAVPPSKPVPPPPRQKHIEKEYSHLVASGRLGSQDSLKTVSTECLASLGGRSPRKRGSDRRRNSEEISKTNIDDVVRRYQDPAKLNRIRPKSFQAPETPKSSFLSLVTKMHQQSSIKSALSLPSLVGDQMKLSPDDDRPFLDPIPRKAKSRSFVGSNATIGLFSERNCSSMKDLSQAGTIESNWLQRHHLKQSSLTDISRDSMRSASATSLSSSTNDLNVMKKPLPPEPNESEADELRSSLTSKSFQGMGLSHHGLGPNSMMSQLLRPPLISQKPVAPPRSSSKNNNAKKLIEEQRSRQGGSGLLSEHYSRAPFVYGRLRQHISFESINEESEQASTPKDETVKLPGDHDHRRSRSEPHERILQNEARSFTLSGRKLTETEISSPVSEQPESNKTLRPTSIEDSDSRIQVACDERGVRTLTYDSRVSSLQSLTSVGSSIRSTVSSKHEQQNLRRAIMNVHGQGAYDLSYKVGAIVYECRPKNKNGLCYGILDDSTEGWYPAESVEPFYMDQQL